MPISSQTVATIPKDGNLISSKVAAYLPNSNGLYDMAGNVAEWTSTIYTEAGVNAMNDLNPQLKYNAAIEDPYRLKRRACEVALGKIQRVSSGQLGAHGSTKTNRVPILAFAASVRLPTQSLQNKKEINAMSNYSKYNMVYRLQKWMDTVPGQTFLNYAYSWGASVVILGALFKLTHLPGANIMLFIGMGTEVVVFLFQLLIVRLTKLPMAVRYLLVLQRNIFHKVL